MNISNDGMSIFDASKSICNYKIIINNARTFINFLLCGKLLSEVF